MKSPKTHERRVYERHDYTGHIVVGRPTKGTTLAGTILNLSIGGCLIKLRAPTDLKTDAVIEIGIHCGTLAFCTLGHIKRHETDASMIGIEFLNLGLEGRRTLRALIAGFKEAQDCPESNIDPKAGEGMEMEAASSVWSVACLCSAS